MFRTTITRTSIAYSRGFHASPIAQKTVTEKVAEVADNVNKKVGKGLADAIGKGQEAAAATKETIDSATEEGKKKARETAAAAEHKKNETAAGVREAKEDLEKHARR